MNFQALLNLLPMPKVVDKKTHAVLDCLTTGFFLVTAGLMWDRNRRAGAVALVNGLFVLSYSLFTDYPGAIRRHGELDIIQAGLAAGLPTVLGFGDEAAALPFRMQAMNEAMVLSITDFGAGTRPVATRRTA